MNADQYTKARSIFLGALKLAASERQTFVTQQAQGDSVVVAAVLAMLATDEAEAVPTKSAPPEIASHLMADERFDAEAQLGHESLGNQNLAAIASHLVHPKTIGPYQILGALGEGGMGTVYKAEQTSPVRRTVAIKIVRHGMDSASVISRFDVERQAMAMMNHPGIAKVYDAGITESGRPYFVMEYVPGEPIDRYCDRHNLPIPERLRLFAELCDAVNHAHCRGVIHRDIKPSNVLITINDFNKPIPKLIDFGVAKATSQRFAEQRAFTEFGQLIGTPEYMAPEQAEMNALDIDTRADVYSLGVVLYELLTGAPPFDPKSLRSAAYAEIQRIIREVDPPRPSTRLTSLGVAGAEIARRRRVDVTQLASTLRDELEWIPIKAMRKDRTERYRSVLELGDDVRNYLASKPLIAGPETAVYRFRKYVKRNQAKVALFAASTAAVLAVTVIAFVLINAARNRAEEDRARAEAARKIAEEERVRATANYESARGVVEEYLTAVSQNQLINTPAMLPLRNLLLSKAVDYYAKFVRDNPTASDTQRDLLQGKNQLAAALTARGDFADALRLNQEILEDRRKLAAANPNNPDLKLQVAQSMINVAQNLHASDQAERAIEAATSAVQYLSIAASQAPEVLALAAELGEATHALGVFHLNAGKTDDAAREFQRALGIRRQLVAADSKSTRFVLDLATTLYDLGTTIEQSNPAEALAYFREAEPIRRRLVDANPSSTDRLKELAELQTWILLVQTRTGEFDNLPAAARVAAASWQTLVNDPRHIAPPIATADGLGFQSYALLLAEDFAAAEQAADLALRLHPAETWIKVNLAHSKLLQGQSAAAEALYLDHPTADVGNGETYRQRCIDGLQLLKKIHPDRGRTIDNILGKMQR